jgi:glucose-6-phosphate isomerase
VTQENINLKILRSIKDYALSAPPEGIKDLLSHERLLNFKVELPFFAYDYSKQRITKKSLDKLLEIPEKINLKKAILDISKGDFKNLTEDRPVSHMLYRDISISNNTAESKEISNQRQKLRDFINSLKEVSEGNIDAVISISIGGSRLGPELLSEVYGNAYSEIKVYYCSSYDFIELEEVMSKLNPSRTIVVISSKSFKTPEVLQNANKAKDWLKNSLGELCWDQILGISSNKEEMQEFGIKDVNQFEVLDSIGGRYSIWSSISLPAIVDMGWTKYKEFLEGAYEADEHFRNSPWDSNIPVLMALFSVWNLNCLNINNLGIFSYDYKIRSLTKYLAQMGMESNGKTYNFDNNKIDFSTCPLIWGGYGPDAQHSVFQWLLQGKGYSACDFIGIKEEKGISDSYKMLLAQITALTIGENDEDLKYRSIEGNNPTSLIQLNDLSPKCLGFLLACYEHKVFVEGIIYGINSFDQWGVELGKHLLKRSRSDPDLMHKYFSKRMFSESKK